jgi:hypothetical protein
MAGSAIEVLSHSILIAFIGQNSNLLVINFGGMFFVVQEARVNEGLQPYKLWDSVGGRNGSKDSSFPFSGGAKACLVAAQAGAEIQGLKSKPPFPGTPQLFFPCDAT